MKVIIHADDITLAARAAKIALAKGKPDSKLPVRYIEFERGFGAYAVYWNKNSVTVWEQPKQS